MLPGALFAATDHNDAECWSVDGNLDDATPSEVANIYESSQQAIGTGSRMTGRDRSLAARRMPLNQCADASSGTADEGTSDVLPTLRELAEAEGLLHDRDTTDPRAPVPWPTPPSTTPLEDADDWPNLDPRRRHAALNLVQHGEKWDADSESVGFIFSTLVLSNEDAFTASITNRYADMRELRVDEPVLKFDPGLEMLRLRARNSVTISTRGIPRFEMHVDHDEDFDWPAHMKLLPQILKREASDVKWDVNKTTMAYIRDILNPGLTDFSQVIETLVEGGKVRVSLTESPTILPLSPPHRPQSLPVDMMNIPLTSSPENLIAAEAEEVGQELLARQDGSVDPPASCSEPGSSAMYSSLEMPSLHSSLFKYSAGEELHAEVPCLPANTTPTPTSPMRPDNSHLPKAVQKLVPSPQSNIDISSDAAQTERKEFIESLLKPLAQAAIQAANNERLVEIDTLMRAPVPAIEPFKPIGPWEEYGTNEQHTLLSRTKHDLPDVGRKWEGVKRIEKTLSWTVFPIRLAKVGIDEELDDDGSCDRCLKQLALGDGLEVEALVGKAEGLRILDGHDSDDEEIEVVEFGDEHDVDMVDTSNAVPLAVQSPPPSPKPAKPKLTKPLEDASRAAQSGRTDLSTLLRKRKMELEAANFQKPVKQVKPTIPPQEESTGPVSDTTNGSTHNRRHTDGHGIGGFLRLHGVAAEPIQPAQGKTIPFKQAAAPPAPAPSGWKPGRETPAEATARTYPTPKLVKPDRAIQIITTTQLLANRTFLRELQSKLPGLDFIERDDVKSSGDAKPRHTEADITISPGLGMIMTTLQKLKQKALPGQSTFNGIRERILQVAPRYEKLILIVSEGRQHDIYVDRSLDERDCDALLDLHGFVAALDTEVEIISVPGGERELIQWTAALISQHSPNAAACQPMLAEATLWEHFLRQAAMNASAAQAILGLLKQPEEPITNESSSPLRSTDRQDFGLAAFVCMSEDQRVQRFGRIMGGAALLRRVSKVIDGPWALR